MLDKIDKFIKHNPKYCGLSKPLTAARVCETARTYIDTRASVISFRDGLLTLGVESSAQAANIQAESSQIISEINNKLGEKLVKRLRYKITDQR